VLAAGASAGQIGAAYLLSAEAATADVDHLTKPPRAYGRQVLPDVVGELGLGAALSV
jgi:hypothetical protein